MRKLGEVDRLVGEGCTTSEAVKRVEVSEKSYYRWRRRSAGMEGAPTMPVAFHRRRDDGEGDLSVRAYGQDHLAPITVYRETRELAERQSR